MYKEKDLNLFPDLKIVGEFEKKFINKVSKFSNNTLLQWFTYSSDALLENSDNIPNTDYWENLVLLNEIRKRLNVKTKAEGHIIAPDEREEDWTIDEKDSPYNQSLREWMDEKLGK